MGDLDNLESWVIYEYTGSDDRGSFTEHHFYRGEVEEKDNLKLVGYCDVLPSYFSTKKCKIYDNKETYSRRDVNKAYREAEQGSTEKGIIGDYFRLRFNYIPQLLKHFTPDVGGYFTPHRSKLKDEKEKS